MQLIGESILRFEDEALLRGQGRFVADIVQPHLAYAVFVRSPVARAKLLAVDTADAERQPQVLRVFTAQSSNLNGALSVNDAFAELHLFDCPLLAKDRLNSVGEAIALVVADSLAAAIDASELVTFEYEEDAPYCTTADAAQGEPLLAGWSDNQAFCQRISAGDPDASFGGAAHIVDVCIDMPRVAPLALETRGILAVWSADSGQLTIWTGVQTPHRARADLARILRIEPERIRVINPDVGGAFGGKASIYPEDVLVAAASMRLNRPIRWTASRNEDMATASHGRGATLRAQAAVDAQGHVLAVRGDFAFPLGCWATYSAAVPAINTLRMLPGPYRIANLDSTARGFVTNTAPVGIYRGAGRPDATLVMEQLMDRAAAATGLDPAEIRRKNLLLPDDLPCETPSGQRLDSGDYLQLLKLALDRSDYIGLRRQQAERRKRGEIVGVGLCLYVEPCGKGAEYVRIVAQADGQFLVACGTSSQGQGHQTALAQIAASELGVDIARIVIAEGDTRVIANGVGALASRSIAIGGSAIKLAAAQMRARLNGANRPPPSPVEIEVAYAAPHEAWSSGCAVACVSIDADTGKLRIERLVWVDDAGLIVNPLLAEGQLLGGLAQGLGQVLCERIHYDESGQLLTGSLMDYAVMRADEMPKVELHSIRTRTDANALGAKGVGESGCIVAPSLILSAAIDALAPLGVTNLAMPLNSESLWRAMQTATQGNSTC